MLVRSFVAAAEDFAGEADALTAVLPHCVAARHDLIEVADDQARTRLGRIVLQADGFALIQPNEVTRLTGSVCGRIEHFGTIRGLENDSVRIGVLDKADGMASAVEFEFHDLPTQPLQFVQSLGCHCLTSWVVRLIIKSEFLFSTYNENSFLSSYGNSKNNKYQK